MKKRIVHFIMSLGVGGAETVVKDYAVFLDKNKYEVIVLVLGSERKTVIERQILDNNIKIIFLGLGSFNSESLLHKVYRQIMRYIMVLFTLIKLKPDILHTHLQVNRFIYLYTCINRKCKLVYTAHSEPSRLFNGNKERVDEFNVSYKLIHNHNMFIISLQDTMNLQLRRLFNTENVFTIVNGVDFDRFANQIIDRQDLRASLGIPSNAFVIGHVGRFSREKNHSFLIELFDSLISQKKVKNPYLLMIGDGPEKIKVIDELSERNINNYKILSNRSDVNFLLSVMDVFIFPSVSEGLGIAAIESQLAGVRTIVSEEVPDQVNISDYFYKLSLNQPIEDWIKAIISTPLGPIQYNDRKQYFNLKTTIARLEKIYDTL